MKKLLEYTKVKTAQEAYQVVKSNLTKNYLSQFKIDYELSYDPKELQIMAKGTGFTMTVQFQQEYCDAELDMSFLLRPFKGKILDALKKQLEQVI